MHTQEHYCGPVVGRYAHAYGLPLPEPILLIKSLFLLSQAQFKHALTFRTHSGIRSGSHNQPATLVDMPPCLDGVPHLSWSPACAWPLLGCSSYPADGFCPRYSMARCIAAFQQGHCE